MDVPRRRRSAARQVRRWLPVGVAAGAILALGTVALGRLGAAARALDRDGLWTGRVERGTMVRRVRGNGQLTAARIRWITAVVSARVEAVPVEPGDRVEPDTIVLELANPDIELAALEARGQVTEARARLADLEADLAGKKLAQRSTISQLRSQLGTARRQAEVDAELVKSGVVSTLELERARDAVAELKDRVAFERERLAALGRSVRAQTTAERARIARLREIAAFRERQLESLAVRAGVAGVLHERSLEPGQWVTPGTLLAKVARPGGLEAELRIPELGAEELAAGQKAEIDTHRGVVPGTVRRVDPVVVDGAVRVEVELDGELPAGIRADQNVVGTVTIARLEDVVFVHRPAAARPGGTARLFVVSGDVARARPVSFGAASVDTIEVTGGLEPGDEVILSDMSRYSESDQIQLK